jgi:hypothetical protein
MTVPGPQHDVQAVGAAFEILGEFIATKPYGNGHINDTYAAVYDQAGTPVRYIHQRINHNIFKDPVRLMENIYRVTTHQLSRLSQHSAEEQSRRALTTLAAKGGLPYHRDPDGNYWRTYLFIEKAKTYDIIETNAQATEAARAFGRFQMALADLPGGRLHETIPQFHHSPWRYENLAKAVAADPLGRLKDCKAEADFALAQKAKVSRLTDLQAQGLLPERVTHNDTKLNNVMIDDKTGEGICVIDLDTVMPGLAAYDFGEMVRTSTMPVKEDETDLTKVVMQWDKFEALTRGYLESAGGFLTPAEKENLAFGGWLMAYENGIRFLTDHLSGDTYFKIHRPNQNLDRARTQLALARDVERNLDKMNRFVASL